MNTMPIAPTRHNEKIMNRPNAEAEAFRLLRLRPASRHCVSLLAPLLVLLVSCSALEGQPDLSGQPSGYAAIIYLNHSSFLVQGVAALAYEGQPPIVWVNAVGPDSWEPLLFDCGFTQVILVSAIPVDLTTGQEGETVLFNLDPLRDGHELTCGSLIVITISDTTGEEGATGLTLKVEMFPDPLPETLRERPRSALSPGAASGLIILRSVATTGVATQIISAWETPEGRVFVSTTTLAGQGPSAASLLECPVDRIGWGNLSNSSTPGAILTDTETEIAAPAPLTPQTGLACGVSVSLRASTGAEGSSETVLSTELLSGESDVPRFAPDLFGTIRRILDEEGFAGKLSTNLTLFPEPGVGDTSETAKTRTPATSGKPAPKDTPAANQSPK